jgi:hypothetical protein
LGSPHITAVALVPFAGPKQPWQRNSPTSLVRAPLRFTSDDDRRLYGKGLRTLALAYAGLLALVVAVTASRNEWRKQELTERASAGTVIASKPAYPRRY